MPRVLATESNPRRPHAPYLRFLVAVLGAALLLLVPNRTPVVGAARVAAENVPHWALYIVNTDGSNLRLLASDPQYGLWGPAISPDGRSIAVTFASADGSRGELYLLDADGSHPRPLTHNGRNNYYPEWSHDGKRIVFVSQQGTDTNTAEIYSINADGTDERRLTNNGAWDYGATWSPDDRQIAFGSNMDGNWQIFLMNSDGSNQHPLPVRAPGNAPKWSPDGRSILLKSDREGNDNIYFMNADGSDQRNLTRAKGVNNNPSWSPDGQHIAFSSDRDGASSIFVMNRDGSQQKNLLPDSGLDAELPAWSPDGQHIFFHASKTDSGPVGFVRTNTGWLGGGLAVIVAIAALAIIQRRRHGHNESPRAVTDNLPHRVLASGG